MVLTQNKAGKDIILGNHFLVTHQILQGLLEIVSSKALLVDTLSEWLFVPVDMNQYKKYSEKIKDERENIWYKRRYIFLSSKYQFGV